MLQYRNIVRIAIATVLLLLIPLIAMQFTDDVTWGPGDFAIAAILLFGAGLTFELVSRKGGTIAYRAAVGVAVGTALVLVWANLAVGIIGSEGNPANLLYFGVLAIGLIGAAIARLQPRGMSHALFATAIAQLLVPMVALIIWRPEVGRVGLVGVLGINFAFALLFGVSALLFRHAKIILSDDE